MMKATLRGLALLLVVSTGFAQTGTGTIPDPSTAAELRMLNSRLDLLQQEVNRDREASERRHAEELATINSRLDDAKNATQWALGLLTFLAGAGTLFGSLSWWANRKDVAADRYDSSRLLTEQIDSIGKVGAVIELVSKTFDLQLKRETNVQALTTMVEGVHKHFTDTYSSVKDRILSLRSVSRMGWSNLSVFQLTLAASARAELRSIPTSVLNEVEKADRYEFARVCQLLGTSAFYANDIGHSEQLLSRAKEIYAALEARIDHRESMAATYFFLGLIAKSWVAEHRPVQDSLRDAKQNLEKAGEILADKADDFVVRVTLAEIESYSEATHSISRSRLQRIVQELEALPVRNENQSRLLVRAYLLFGNLHGGAAAETAYQRALGHDPRSAYAMLSIARNSPQGANRENWFAQGLEALKASRAMDKHELTTRATALAWAVIATSELARPGEHEQYRRELEGIQAAAVNTGGKLPLFFSPVTRTLRLFDELHSDIASTVQEQRVAPHPDHS